MLTKKIPTSHKGRRCKYPNCKSVLSIYNHRDYCNIHLNKLSGESRWKVCEK